MSKRKPKNVDLPTPPEAQERLSPADRGAFRLALLEHQNAAQRVQLLVHEHGTAMAAAKAMEQKLQQLDADIAKRYQLTPADRVDLSTGAITRAPAPAEATK